MRFASLRIFWHIFLRMLFESDKNVHFPPIFHASFSVIKMRENAFYPTHCLLFGALFHYYHHYFIFFENFHFFELTLSSHFHIIPVNSEPIFHVLGYFHIFVISPPFLPQILHSLDFFTLKCTFCCFFLTFFPSFFFQAR